MTLLLEYREKIKRFYRLNSVVILPVLKFLVAFFALNGVNTLMGYMPKLDNIAIVLIASLACSFLPAGCLTLLCAAFSLAHIYSLSWEAAVVGLCIYLVLFLMLLRFSPKNSYVVVLTPLLFALKMPYLVPIVVGLLGSPVSAVSVACGVIVYYFLTMIVGCAPTLRTMEDDLADKLRYLIENIVGNKAVLVIAGSFAVTVVVVYLIRRMSVEHAWTIAMVAGAMVNLVLLLIGDLIYDIKVSMGGAILGSIVAILIAKIIEFFRFCVDYSRTERVQFEDDDYYYYVKAVPKMSMAASTKTVKRINAQSGMLASDADRSGRTAGISVNAAGSRSTANTGRTTRTASQMRMTDSDRESVRRTADRRSVSAQTQGMSGSEEQYVSRASSRAGASMSSGSGSYGAASRSVSTERTNRPAGAAAGVQRRTNYSNQGMTVRSSQMPDDSDDYEELY